MSLCQVLSSLEGSAAPKSAILTVARLQVRPFCAGFTNNHGLKYNCAASIWKPKFKGRAAHRRNARCCRALARDSSEVAGEPGTSYARGETVPYRWSWQEEDTEAVTTVYLDHAALAATSSVTDLTTVLRTAAAAAPSRATLSASSRDHLDAAAAKLLPCGAAAPPAPSPCTVGDAARLLEAYSALSYGGPAGTTPAVVPAAAPPPFVASVIAHVCAARPPASVSAGAAQPLALAATAQDLASLLWALSELPEEVSWSPAPAAPATRPQDRPHDPPEPQPQPQPSASSSEVAAVVASAPAVLQRAIRDRLRNQDFLGPDLCRVVCALGGLASAGSSPAAAQPPAERPAAGSSAPPPASGGRGSAVAQGFQLDPELVAALNEEIRYQLTEFAADFEAEDLGRLILGMAGLRLGAAVAGDEEYRRVLMKAVYGKTRSLLDKAAVDFALSRLMSDDPEARSMHYDSRWTHEELHWLPRRERDKRRILKEGWYRTQWGGWSPGGGN